MKFPKFFKRQNPLEDPPPIDVRALAVTIQTAMEKSLHADFPELQLNPEGELAKLHARILKLVELYDKLRSEHLKMLKRMVAESGNMVQSSTRQSGWE